MNFRFKKIKKHVPKKLQKDEKYFFRRPRTEAKKIFGTPGLMFSNAEFCGQHIGANRFSRYFFAQLGPKIARNPPTFFGTPPRSSRGAYGEVAGAPLDRRRFPFRHHH